MTEGGREREREGERRERGREREGGGEGERCNNSIILCVYMYHTTIDLEIFV